MRLIIRKEGGKMGINKKIQNSFALSLNRKNAIFLIASCLAQLLLWSVNLGQSDGFKWILAAGSCFFMLRLLFNLWRTTAQAERTGLLMRVFSFALFFDLLIIVSNLLVGGVISLIFGYILLIKCVKIAA